MKVNLMFRDKDFEITSHESYHEKALIKDLELEYTLEDMAREDEIIYESSKEALMKPLKSIEDIFYRQANLSDVFDNADAIRELYKIVVETEEKRKESINWLSGTYLPSIFSSSVRLLDLYIEMLRKLRLVADHNLDNLQSDGFRKLFILFQKELDDDYIETVKDQLDDLQKSDGTLISSKMGNYLQGVQYIFREKEKKRFWRRWLFAPSYKLAERDNRGAEDLGERRERAINEPTNILAQASENLESFFTMLRQELAFYVGCLNLSETIKKYDMSISMPEMLEETSYDRSWQSLYDISLLLTNKSSITGNKLITKDKRLYLITGANQGGKTTFLRSVGQAQIMAQSGMFVCASNLVVPIRNAIFTHFEREEDKTFTSGKLDEELVRMSDIVDHLDENSLVLLNESFAATNEREGSEINNQITRALIDSHVEVFSVTHLYTYASSFTHVEGVQYLRAQRLDDATRTFKIEEGKPLLTAYGEDIYHQIFDE